MGGIATYTQLPSWSALLKIWARFESAADVVSCFDLGLCKSFQKGRRGTVTITPKKQPQRLLGAGLKYVTNELTAWHYKRCHQKTLCPHAFISHYKSALLEDFHLCLAFACALKPRATFLAYLIHFSQSFPSPPVCDGDDKGSYRLGASFAAPPRLPQPHQPDVTVTFITGRRTQTENTMG